MKTIGIAVFFVFLIAALWCCEKNPGKPPADIDIQNLFQVWKHAYEEEQPGDSLQIYRPGDFKEFSPSRFRMTYIFAESGGCEWLYLHPADAHYLKRGKWKTCQAGGKLILIYDANDQLVESVSFRIVELKEDILKIMPVKF